MISNLVDTNLRIKLRNIRIKKNCYPNIRIILRVNAINLAKLKDNQNELKKTQLLIVYNKSTLNIKILTNQ